MSTGAAVRPIPDAERPTRGKRAIGVAVVLTLVAVLTATAAPTPARADVGQFLWLNEDGAESATYGPNSVISINLGAIAYACDTFYPVADVYVVAGTPADGATLADVSGGVNVVFGSWGGGIIGETIAVTAPAGNLGEGTYTVVYDECQDGKFDAGLDAAFVDAITVDFPPGELPPIDPAVIAFKGPAGQQAQSWRRMLDAYGLYLKLSELYDTITCVTGGLVSCLLSTMVDELKSALTDAAMGALGLVDVKVAALDVAEDYTRHWEGLRDDPPDPAFDQLTPLEVPADVLTPASDTPTETTWVGVGNAASVDAALTEALLHAVERYQGADAAEDPEWALAQARAAREYAGLLAARAPATAGSLDTFAAALEAETTDLDAVAALYEAGRERMVAVGFTPEEEAALRSRGLDDADIAALQTDLADSSVAGFSEAELLDAVRDQADVQEATVAPLQALIADLDGAIETLSINSDVPTGLPTARAGGPYTTTSDGTVALAGGGSSDPGGSITTFAWDLDLDGDFDDATGAAPTVDAPGVGSRLIGLRVTDGDGNQDTGYATVTVTDANSAPSATPTPAAGTVSVAVGDSQLFEVATVDADSDDVTVTWHLDGVQVGTGTGYTYGPTTEADIGLHDLRATIDDGTTSRMVVWGPDVLDADDDTDGWHANVDCDDTDDAVNPAALEIEGNGVDDDCDVATSDAVVNDAPIASNVLTGTAEDTPVTVTLAAIDPEGDPMTFTIVDPPATGSLGAVTGNQVTFTPATDETGPVTFTFRASDGELQSAVRTVTVSVTPVADVPVANDVAAVTTEDNAVAVTLNGTDPDGDPLTYAIDTPPATGSLGAVVGNQVTFTPAPDASGDVTFTYTASDASDTSVAATVTVAVLPVDDPVGVSDTATATPEDTPVDVALPVVDPDGDDLEFIVASPPAFGQVTVDAAGTATYTPSTDYSGADTFTWYVSDGTGLYGPAVVDITVSPVDDPPSADSLTAIVPEDAPTTIALVGHDPDSLLTYTVVTPPSHGTLGPVVGRRVLYTAADEYAGPDSFTYRVTGDGVDSTPATVTLDVRAVNDPPVAVDDAAATDNGTPVTVDVLTNDSDIDGGALTVSSLGAPTTGSAFVSGAGDVTYTAPVGFSGVAHVPYTLSDSAGGVATATLTVLVTDGPVDSRTWTNETDFSVGESFNVEQVGPNDLTIQDEAQAFNRVWVAVSSKGTIVQIDTRTNTILGEYRTAPQGQPLNPSRTTVDLNGNVWATNRDGNSVVRIGLLGNDQCEDRNGNGTIETSTGLDDIKPWPNTAGADTNGGVTTAEDECIIDYTRVSSSGTRHVSITADNDVWISGTGNRIFDLIDGDTGQIVRSEGPVGYGGYGGLIDPNGVIWSSTWGSPMMRWDTALPLTGPAGGNWTLKDAVYGLCIDPAGNVWGTYHGSDLIRKYAPDGTLLGSFPQGNFYAQGCAVDQNGDVWVAHSLTGQNTVGHLKNDGTYVGTVTVGAGPTGVAVDADGRVWATNYNAGTVSRIDPDAGPVGLDGETPVGAVDYTSPYLGGLPYNYSDMTGSTLTGMPQSGTWTATFDSGEAQSDWAAVAWRGATDCTGGDVEVRVSSSEDGVTFSTPVEATSGEQLTGVAPGRYLKVVATLIRCTSGDNVRLRDLTAWTMGPAAPIATDDEFTTPEETPIDVTLVADTDPSGGTLDYEILKAPSFGTLGPIDEDGVATYTPDEDYNGYDSVGFRVDDGTLRSDPAYTVIEVTPVNDPPEAADLAAPVVYETPTEIELLGSDVDGDELTYTVLASPLHGTVGSVAEDGTVTYTPDDGYVGPDSFTYAVWDGAVESEPATVSITVGSTTPGPPIDVAAIGGDENARVTWETPLSDGGSPITGYEVRVIQTGATTPNDPDPRVQIVGGLQNDTEYSFEVRARNVNGFGPWSEPSNLARTRPSCETDAFTDVTSEHPFCPEITWMAENGVAEGYPDDTYRPVAPVSRGAMSAFLYRLAGAELGVDPLCTAKPFPDVNINNPFCGEIDWTADEDIVGGYPDGTFRPAQSITRQTMAVYLYRLSGSPRGADPTCTRDEFPDVPMGHQFCGEIDWMVDSGVTGGFDDGTFGPQLVVSRQAMAAFIFRYNVLEGFITE